MPFPDEYGRMCGYLEMEEQSGNFYRRYFILEQESGRLFYFTDNPKRLPKGSKPLGSIQVDHISQVSEAGKQRPKMPFCFAITIAGKKTFFKAPHQDDMEMWIKILTNASIIKVPKAEVEKLERNRSQSDPTGSYMTDVVGGVVVKTSLPCYSSDSISSSSCSEDEGPCTHPHHQHYKEPLKVGYCVKQGARVKNWKRRFFVLDDECIAYFKNERWQGKTPIKSINISDIYEVRESRGVHPTRENLFEIVTQNRVFYVQCDSEEEMTSWIVTLSNAIASLGHVPSKPEDLVDDTLPRGNAMKAEHSMWV